MAINNVTGMHLVIHVVITNWVRRVHKLSRWILPAMS